MGVEGAGTSCAQEMEEDAAIDIEGVEEQEGETMGPTSIAVDGRKDLEPVTYWLGRSKVTEVDLDKYVVDGLIHSTMHTWCRLQDLWKLLILSPTRLSFSGISLRLVCNSLAKISWAKYCGGLNYRFTI